MYDGSTNGDISIRRTCGGRGTRQYVRPFHSETYLQFLQMASTVVFSVTFLAAIDIPDVLGPSDRMVLHLGYDLVTILAKLRDHLGEGTYRVFDHGLTLGDGACLLKVVDDLLLLSHACLLFPTVVFEGLTEGQQLLMEPLPLVVAV